MKLKNLFIPSVIVLLTSLGLGSCDVIENPLKEGGVIDTTGNDTLYRNVFIEDFTGHRCKNCPKAAHALEQIQDIYGDRVVAIGIHSGPSEFTGPLPPDYPSDFRTADGDAIAAFFGGVPAQPIGMVNRINYTGSGTGHYKLYPSWASETASMIDQVAIAKIEATATVSGSSLNTNVKVTFIGSQSGNYKLAVYLVENGIVAPQLLPDDTRDASYVHHNVLRKAISFNMGDALVSGTIADGSEYSKSYTTPIDVAWDNSNLKAICILIDDANQEVMQVISVDAQ